MKKKAKEFPGKLKAEMMVPKGAPPGMAISENSERPQTMKMAKKPKSDPKPKK